MFHYSLAQQCSALTVTLSLQSFAGNHCHGYKLLVLDSLHSWCLSQDLYSQTTSIVVVLCLIPFSWSMYDAAFCPRTRTTYASFTIHLGA